MTVYLTDNFVAPNDNFGDFDSWKSHVEEEPNDLNYNPFNVPLYDKSWISETRANRMADHVARIGTPVDHEELHRGDRVTFDGKLWEYIGGAWTYDERIHTYSFAQLGLPRFERNLKTLTRAELIATNPLWAADE